MKKKCLLFFAFLIFVGLFGLCFNFNDKKEEKQKIVYNNANLLISIDGQSSDALPFNGDYYLVGYECDNANTEVFWNTSEHELYVSNGEDGGSVSCNLNFRSNPNLYEMPIGSYISYEGVGGTVGSTSVSCKKGGSASNSDATIATEAPNSCLGQNARQDLDTSGYTYGYCHNVKHKFYTTGWRLAYIDGGNKPVIISAGSPECIDGNTSYNISTFVTLINTSALKYCNSEYVDGDCICTDSNGDGYCDCTDSDSDGVCDQIENGTVDAWAVTDLDFYNITKTTGGIGKRLGLNSSNLGDNGGTIGKLYCSTESGVEPWGYKECGYNNDLLDNGSYYWFSAFYNSTTSALYWNPERRSVDPLNVANTGIPLGIRPVISLSSSIFVIGGDGTMERPYEISSYLFNVNNNATFTTSTNVTLSIGATNVTQMCISNTSTCTDYEAYATTKSWTLSSGVGEKTVYIYFKDSSGNIVKSKTDTIYLDNVVPVPTFTTSDSIASGSWHNAAFTLTASNYSSNYTWQYKIGNGGTWTSYAGEALSVSNQRSGTGYYFKACSKNFTSNCSNATYVAKLDTTNPTVSIDLAAGTYTGTQIVTVTGADTPFDGSNFSYLRIVVLHNDVEVSRQSVYSTSSTVSLNESGTWKVSVRSVDKAGNISDGGTWTQRTYTINMSGDKNYFYTNSGTSTSTWQAGYVQTDGWSFSTSGGLKAYCGGNWGPTYWYTTADLTNYSKLCYQLHYYHYGSSSTVRETSVSVGVISSFDNPSNFVDNSTYGTLLRSGLTFNSTYSKTWNSCQLKASDGSTNCYFYTKNYTETGCIDVSGLTGNQIIGFADRGDGEVGDYYTTLYYMYGEI